LPSKKIRLSLTFGFIDSWDGEAAIITINGQEVWRQTSSSAALGATAAAITASRHTAEICGSSDRPPRTYDLIMQVQRDLVISPPADGKITIRVSSTLDQPIDNESFVISNIKIEASS